MAYATARGDAEHEQLLSRLYVAESLRSIPQGKYLTVSLEDLLEPKQADTRGAAEVIADLQERGAFKVVSKK